MQSILGNLSGGLATGAFAKNSLGWQLQKLTLWAQEALERLFSSGDAQAAPPPQLPSWLLQSLFWLMALAASGWLVWQFCQILLPYWQTLRPPARPPTQPHRTSANWLQQAQQAQQQGDYTAACRALYLATLQRLGEQNLISPQASRTDGEYLTLLQTLSLQVPQPYRLLIQTHERLHFDRLPASAELYAECWQAYQQIQRIEQIERQSSQPAAGGAA